jgi:hypothetical protein
LASIMKKKIRFIFKVFFFAWRKKEVEKIVPIEEWKNWFLFQPKRS